jgi:hypothetical protein
VDWHLKIGGNLNENIYHRLLKIEALNSLIITAETMTIGVGSTKIEENEYAPQNSTHSFFFIFVRPTLIWPLSRS